MELRYDISQLFNSAFGFVPVRFNTKSEAGKAADLKYQAQLGQGEAVSLGYQAQAAAMGSDGQSDYGTPVLFPVTFQGKTYRYYDNGQIKTRKLGELLLPYTTLANYRQRRRVVMTPISGRQGTVKELFASGDWSVELAGVMVGNDIFTYPEAQVRQLLEFKDMADSIPVAGRMFELLGIDELVITGIELPRAKGYPYAQPFRIRAVSDEAVELVMK